MNSKNIIDMSPIIDIIVVLVVVLNAVTANCPNIISRNEWGARSTNLLPLTVNPPTHIIIHHSNTTSCTLEAVCKERVKSIQNYHINFNRWEDIGYNFLVGQDGNIYEGRGWGKHGAHAPRYNDKSIGVCVLGDFSYSPPNNAALQALKQLISCGVYNGYIKKEYKLVGHRQVRSTNCPGDALYNEIKTWDKWASQP